MVVPRKVAVTGEDAGKVVVNKTVQESYVREPTEEEKVASKNSSSDTLSEDNGEGGQGVFQTLRNAGEIPRNRLAELFQQLQTDFDEDEQFYFMLTRMPDMFNDSFRVPCNSAISFQPLPFFSNQMLNLFPMLQKANGNSGGRFQLVVLDSNTEDTGYGIKALVIPNPFVEEKLLVDNNGNPDMQAILGIIEKQRQDFQQMMQGMINQSRQQPQEDELVKALRQKMYNDLMNPPQQKDRMEEMLAAPVMLTTFATAMGEAFKKMLENTGSGGDSRPKGTVEMLLENDLIINKAGEFLNKVGDAATIVLSQRSQPPNFGQPPPVYNPQPNGGYPPLGGVPYERDEKNESMEEERKFTREELENVQKIEDIVAELEDDTPIDDSNEFLLELKEEYPDQYKLAKTMCGALSFDEAMKQLMPLVPFKDLKIDMLEFINPNTQPPTYTERGTKLFARLELLYNYIKNDNGEKKNIPDEIDETSEKAGEEEDKN